MPRSTTPPVLRRGDTVDQAVRGLREGIVSGRYAPGQRLISRELTETFGFSRSTVREALSSLASEGLLDLIPNRGAAVRQMGRVELHELFLIRELMEGLSARLAAQAMKDPKRKAQLKAIAAELNPNVSPAEFHRQNRALHELLLDAGGNAQLRALVEKMHVAFVMSQVRLSMGPEQIARSQREHVEISKAVLSGDADRAEAAMRRHLRNTAEWIDGLPETAFRQS